MSSDVVATLLGLLLTAIGVLIYAEILGIKNRAKDEEKDSDDRHTEVMACIKEVNTKLHLVELSQATTGAQIEDIRRTMDANKEAYRSEAHLIRGELEVVNRKIDLVDKEIALFRGESNRGIL